MLFINYLNIIILLINSKIVYSNVTSSSDFFAKQSFLVQTGFSNIVWTYIGSSDFKQQNVSSSCKSSLYHVIESIKQGQDWAFKLSDASGRVPADFIGLGSVDPGNYDKCLTLDWTGPSGLKEASKYCFVSLLPNNEQNSQTKIYTQDKLLYSKFGFDIQIGFCIPSTCSNDDLTITLKEALKSYSWDLVTIRNCEVKTHFIQRLVQASTLQKICLFILAILVLTVFYSTYLDRQSTLSASESPTKFQWFKHFSIISSYRQIAEPNWSSGRMLFLVKFAILMHSIVLLEHVIAWPFFSKTFPFIAVSSQVALHQDRKILQYTNAEWINEGIFVYGGTARALDLWKNIGPGTSFTRLLINIVFKWISLSFLMAITMFIQIVLPLFISGPSGVIKNSAKACEKSFFKVIFQHNHWLDGPDDYCLVHFWTVNVESYYLILLVTLIYLYKRRPKIALYLNIILLGASLLFVASHFYINQHKIHAGIRVDDYEEAMRYGFGVYATGFMHLWIYMPTILSVYLIMNNYDDIINKVHFLRIVSRNLVIFAGILSICPMIYFFAVNFNQTRFTDAIYAALQRVLVIIFYSIVLLLNGEEAKRCCSKAKKVKIDESDEDNNTIGNIESISISPGRGKFYHVLSTILRSTYWIHIPVLIVGINSLRYPILTQSGLIYHLTGQIFYCLFGGFLFHLFVNAPTNSIFHSLKKSLSL
ncbi:uncharacterized protein LOC107366831 [Tetranychus urticae]|uniref:uncharacterized protein LOC107366831 n=1 Tax=Tetranychus urticae TaxID=32264 RepID=UPI00077BB606|nr:uncharacterized protein LOC107366831 [Tetranychus urticae]